MECSEHWTPWRERTYTLVYKIPTVLFQNSFSAPGEIHALHEGEMEGGGGSRK
jgi:hypothetical protein